MTADDLRRLTALLEKYGMAEFEYQNGEQHILISLEQPSTAVSTPTTEAQTAPARICAPHAGIFRIRHPLEREAKPLPRMVETGEIVGYMQVDAVLRPVIAPQKGAIGLPRIPEGTLAGYGTHLYDLHIVA